MNAPSGAWIDGTPASDGLIRDRGLHYGDGLFETMTVRRGRLRFATLHAARLARGCRKLGIECDAEAVLRDAAGRVGTNGTLKVIVTRGDAVARGYAVSGSERARSLYFWYPASAQPPFVVDAAVTLSQRWGENPELAGLKHLNRLEQVLARRELTSIGADEGLVASTSGWLVSGTQGNVLLWRDGGIVTPRVDRCGIAGVMRAAALREAGRLGIRIEETDVPMSSLDSVEAIAFTNARIGVAITRTLDGRVLQMPGRLQQLAAVMDSLDE